MLRVAAVDLGTNSTRLLVADVEAGRVDALVRRTTVTRLGEGVDASRRLLPAAVERVLAALAEYQVELDRHGVADVLAVATSAVRDAANGADFLGRVETDMGLPTWLVSGDEEAELTRRGVGALAEGTLLVDIGGGSTELVLGTVRRSLDVGSVRLTERFLRSDPPRPEELAAAAEHVRALLPPLDVHAAVGVAGTVAQLELLAGPLTAGAVDAELARLAALPLAERRELPGLEPDRAPVIVGGAVIAAEVIRRYGVDGLAFSERDLLDGVALMLADAPPSRASPR